VRKLERIVLINAAGFDYLEFPVGGHTQVIGVNGHGKSTLLRTVLFFYLGTNEKAPYALHDTKRDFVSHYLGDPPSYLIYEVSRGENEPGWHVVVTRPAGRIQFHFIDAPYSRDHYLEGRFVQPVETVLERLREARLPCDTLHSYEDFTHRIYGMVPSTYAVFHPASRAAGQVNVLSQIISGIFTVSQLNADKLKSTLICGVRRDALATELDLVQLKNHLENFRRVNRAVKTYLRYEQSALDLVELADEYERVKTERQQHIEELVRMAKRLPEEGRLLASQRETLQRETTAAEQEFTNREKELTEEISRFKQDIAVLGSKIADGEKIRTEYLRREITRKAAEIDGLPSLRESLRIATEEYDALTAKYEVERHHKDQLIASARQGWIELDRQFQNRINALEREAFQALQGLQEEKDAARNRIESESSDVKKGLVPRRERLDTDRATLNEDFRAFADVKPPEEIDQTARKLHGTEQRRNEVVTRQERLRGQIAIEKQKAEFAREKLDREAFVERKDLETELAQFQATHKRVEGELESFDASLARYYQAHVPEAWSDAARTLNRETLFRNAAELGTESAGGPRGTAWGVSFSTGPLPEPLESYDGDELAARLRELRVSIKDTGDRQQAATERYFAAHDALERTLNQTNQELDAELSDCTEMRNRLSDEIIRLDNALTTLKSQFNQSQTKVRATLDLRDADWKNADAALRGEAAAIDERFRFQLCEIESSFGTRSRDLNQKNAAQLADITAKRNQAFQDHEGTLARIERDFQEAISGKGVDARVVAAAQQRITAAETSIKRIHATLEEVAEYRQKKREWIDVLPSWESQIQALTDSRQARESALGALQERRASVMSSFKNRGDSLVRVEKALNIDLSAWKNFQSDGRFMQEQGYPDRADLPPAVFYQAGALHDRLIAAGNAHENREDLWKRGDKNARTFLNRFDSETLQRRVLGFSPIYEEHFNWTFFADGELKPFVVNRGIAANKRIQTLEFTQLIQNINNRNADFREGIRQVGQIADLVQTHLQENNFVDVLDSIELKVERVDIPLTRTLTAMEEFADVSFSTDQDLFAKRADQTQIDRAIETFERLMIEIDGHPGRQLSLTDYFDFSIRVHENGHDMGWRKSLDHIGSTGTDYLVKMLIYLSLIEVYRARALDSKFAATVHCVLDETGVLAAKYVRSVLEYAATRGIILITAGHSQQTTGFENWILVRKRGQRFAGQTVLRKILRCD
jgi:hypothetical protein